MYTGPHAHLSCIHDNCTMAKYAFMCMQNMGNIM